ncbi:hypothetical protein C475_11730 [Halosimplex carlsbadense 2-9-1]|uniref:Uncharacterized protein n=1 Tax=Halosimplex carlsbadense 2-9-1 TaxID=797114 RepID=M0CNQ5_9EURY|nr:hypothetical protein C475_11730 [Halosimplex carlsbadense 2-9-1]
MLVVLWKRVLSEVLSGFLPRDYLFALHGRPLLGQVRDNALCKLLALACFGPSLLFFLLLGRALAGQLPDNGFIPFLNRVDRTLRCLRWFGHFLCRLLRRCLWAVWFRCKPTASRTSLLARGRRLDRLLALVGRRHIVGRTVLHRIGHIVGGLWVNVRAWCEATTRTAARTDWFGRTRIAATA